MCFIDYSKAFDCVDHPTLWNMMEEMGIPENIAQVIRSLYATQEAKVRTEYGDTESFSIGKGVRQGCVLSPYLFNLYSEYIMRPANLEELDIGMRMGGRKINNLRYADDTSKPLNCILLLDVSVTAYVPRRRKTLNANLGRSQLVSVTFVLLLLFVQLFITHVCT